MALLECPNCGQSYDPKYMLYCAWCGEAVPDEHGKRAKPGPLDGFGARGGATTPRSASPQHASSGAVQNESRPATPSAAVGDIVAEHRNRLNEEPDDHAVRYSLALAYLYARQWDEAAAEFARVVAAVPDFAEAHHRLAISHANSGRLPQALDAARTASSLVPDSEEYQRLVGRVAQAMDDVQ